jgi:hypothetical protein
MTDENLGVENNILTQEVSQEPAEKMLAQSQVNEIVRAAQARAAEKAKREMQEQFQIQQQQNMQAPSMSSPQFNEDALRQMIAEESRRAQEQIIENERRRADEAAATQMAQEIIGKLAAGKTKYEDFETVVQDMGISNYPQLMKMANQFDNLHDIVYELGTNPSKIGSLAVLAYTNPQLAQKEMRSISEAIKRNETAQQNHKSSPQPLVGLKPSTAGRDNGKTSVSDLRKNPAFRL